MSVLHQLDRPQEEGLAPGLHLFDFAPPRPGHVLARHGVPLFVGFAQARRPGAAVELRRWDQFGAWLRPEPTGHLVDAVRGFFANGGSRCYVLPVGPSPSREALLGPLQGGGSAEDVEAADLLCLPDADLPGSVPGDLSLSELHCEVIRHCEALGTRMALLEAPGNDADAWLAHRQRLPYTRHAALYVPRVEAETDVRGSRRMMPVCGHVAGVIARSDATHGVHKAPANELLEGVLRPAAPIGEAQHAQLNKDGINCIVERRGRGIRVMGARTLSQHPRFAQLSISRTFIALTQWLMRDLRDVVFESNDPALWSTLRLRIGEYCEGLLGAGASKGYFVKCDAENNPATVRDAGQLVAEIGLAPTVPAEFVVVRVTHGANGIVVSET